MADLHQSPWTWNNFFLGLENQNLDPFFSQTQAEKETDWACAHNGDLMLLLLGESIHALLRKGVLENIGWFVRKAISNKVE